MAQRRDPTPVGGPDAFAGRGRDARLSQAAIVLAIGAAAGGVPERVDESEALGLPDDLAACGQPEPIPVAQAAAPLAVELDEHVGQPRPLPAGTSVGLMSRLIEQPDPVTAAALVEANLHNESRLVRTAAAVAALSTTGPRDDLLAHLVEGATRGDQLTKDIARIGVARIDPQHDVLRHLVGRPSPLTRRDRPSHTAVLTHGTFAAMTQWWRSGGDFYEYLDGLVPPLKLHDPSFGWSGLYSDGARQLAAQQLAAWLVDQNLQRPDFFAHSHGGTVANLATQLGVEFDRLVLLSWSVHRQWFPDFDRIGRIIDIRVRADLVILADLGLQTFPVPPAAAGKVTTYKNGWYQHELTHSPTYWNQYHLPDVL